MREGCSLIDRRRGRKPVLEYLCLLEPRSVLERRRSPSPPTSSSTLTSYLDTAGVAAVPDKWPLASSSSFHPAAASPQLPAELSRKEEWPAEPRLIMAALAGGFGVEDWGIALSDSAAFPAHDQSLLRWTVDDVHDSTNAAVGLKHQLLSQFPLELDASSSGWPSVDSASGFEGTPASAAASNPPPLPSFLPTGGGFGSPALDFGRGQSNDDATVRPPPAAVNNPSPPLTFPPAGVFFQESMAQKPLPLGLNQHQQPQTLTNASFVFPLPRFRAHQEIQLPKLLPPHLLTSHLKCQPSAGDEHLFRQNQPLQQLEGLPRLNAALSHLQPKLLQIKLPTGEEGDAAVEVARQQQEQQQQALVDQLFMAAKLVEAGNSGGACGILARLNHQLLSPVGKPLLRSAFYFKEALQLIATGALHPPPLSSTPVATPYDVLMKLDAYKSFFDISPIIQFTQFTCIQAILEGLSGADRIHIIDFDIGVGGQWSSFMQELAERRCSTATAASLLKITAFVSPCSHYPLELLLIRENLYHFAGDLNIPFEFNILSLDPLDPSFLLTMLAGVDEAVAVNLPVGSGIQLPIPSLLRLVRQLSPKIVVSVDYGCDRSDLPFAYHFFHAFQSCAVLLDSIDAAGTNQDAANKIERFLVQPRIENSVLGRHRAADKMLPWKTLFASAGFVPVQCSNLAETQAECLLKRVQVRGFHVEKHQASLFLCWQHRELVSVSAWRC